ncbi:vWA domain-containing protein [Flammeovirga agarivorans]|uniref:VWA domain-containing protein n=1 Tax=Flammeovirga agarivorans TaxID=2726742 RepID=A0A7X8SPB1_9BACT|nr:vWA domain-containing protein [Flammeovirga agarivorans]NLR93820.1 VWA domain-containing protein [Flammeovirga agarivorans]
MKGPHLNIGSDAGFKVDIMLLADNTGSMGSAINDVKANFVSAYQQLLTSTDWDAEVGVSYYKDSTDSDPFVVLQEITNDDVLLQSAVNNLNASGGGDTPEGQLYALTQLSERTVTGWRPGATRIICWFGDQPGHDPVTINGQTCTLESTCEALLHTNTFVCAFSMDPSNNLNGSEQQATVVTNKTNGVNDGEYVKFNVVQDGVVDFIFNFIKKHTP